MSTRYKEGPGRLEHSVWSPMTIKASTENRDLAGENIPYVVLSNIYSMTETVAFSKNSSFVKAVTFRIKSL